MKSWRVISAMCLALSLYGCAVAPEFDDPVTVMLDRSRDPVKRLAAAKQLGPIRDADDPDRIITLLHDVLWSDAYPVDLRLYALDTLIDHDADTFWQVARLRIREVDRWEVLGPVIDRAVAQHDPGLTPILIRSLARPSQIMSDQERPELAAISAINPAQSVEQTIWHVLVSDDPALSTAERVDAWVLMNRLFGSAVARARLEHATSTDPLILDLQAAHWLGRLPDNQEGVLWLMQLRSEPNRSFWQAAEARADGLTDAQRHGLELRHLPALMQTSDAQLNRDVAAIRADLLKRVSTPGAIRTKTGVARELPSECLADHIEGMCFGDLVTLSWLMDAMRDAAFTDTLFMQADADLADTTTEHGGVLVIEHHRPQAIPFMPTVRMHDQKFYASNALIDRLYTGLLHYHFHAQKYRNTEYAGPGVGDLAFVDQLRVSAVVFTFLDEDTLNVDYYQPGDVVVDLGVIRR